MSINQDKFGVFWYNLPEICQWQAADFENKAAEFAAAGVNIVMTFSCTHFRWSYYPWRHIINEALKKMVKACHNHGIRVVEHHSSHLTFAPHSHRDWDALKRKMVIRNGSLDMFPGLREHLAMGDSEIAPGVFLSDCRQIDGRTGRPASTGYGGYAHCFNNPHFKAAYLKTLEDVYAAGVDGIMTDDVQYFGEGHACTCKYCREKFKAETDFDLPVPYEWYTFAGNYSNPAYIAFLKFRVRSTELFQRDVNKHFESLGLKLLRPNYATSTFSRNITGYPFEAAADLWTHVFQENMFSSVIRSAWPSWSCDAMHRSAIARKYSVDPMSMFYPTRYDDYYFSWALSRLWEHLLMATPEGGDLNEVETIFAEYEKHHPRLAGEAQPMAEVGFLQPRNSMDYAFDPVESASRPFHVWLQSALFTNTRASVIFEEDPLSIWQQYKVVAVAGATMLADEQLELMKQYVKSGGKLLIFGKFGIYRPDGSLREHPEAVFSFNADLVDFHPVEKGVFAWQNHKIELEAVEESCSLSNISGDCQVVAQSCSGEVLGVSACSGKLLWLAGGIVARRPAAVHYGVIVSRWGSDPDKAVPAPAYVADYIKNYPGRILKAFINDVPQISCSDSRYITSCYCTGNDKTILLHLVNIGKVLARPPETISHIDRFENFMPNAPANAEEVIVEFKLPDKTPVPQQVRAFSPEFTGEKSLSYSVEGNILAITIPAGTFAGYLGLEVK